MLSLFNLRLEFIHLPPQHVKFIASHLLGLESSLKGLQFLIYVGNSFLRSLQTLFARSILLSLKGMNFYLKLEPLALKLVDSLGFRFAIDTYAGI